MGVWHHRDGTKTEYGRPLDFFELYEYYQTWRQRLAQKIRKAMK